MIMLKFNVREHFPTFTCEVKFYAFMNLNNDFLCQNLLWNFI